ncbi:MAG: double-strand break repair protein AddB [Rhodobiaceae bacterium]|nr:double-strand break repair protein AddB [Rhodobiaceae bacterium]
MAARGLNLFSIDPTAPFLETLADAIDAGDLLPHMNVPDDPLARADLTILLPTRRACRAMRDVYLKRANGAAAVLPRIRPIGDVDEDAFDFIENSGSETIDLPPSIDSLSRHILLTRLIMRWKREVGVQLSVPFGTETLSVPAGVGDAVKLAGDLIALLDGVETEGGDLKDLAGLVPEDFSAYYQVTLEFLRIVTEWWPQIQAESGVIEPSARRNLLLDAQAARLDADPAHGPVIAAGSTASIPASARLLGAIARHPNGAVVLPGLDFGLDDASFEAVLDEHHISHPQYGMAQFLRRLGAVRDDVRPLGGAESAGSHRLAFLAEVMRPAEKTDAWRDLPGRLDRNEIGAALDNITAINAENERYESLSIALALREAVEDPDLTAALVTPDRALATRVAADLRRWGLDVDDSAGTPLMQSAPGTVARLILDAVREAMAPVETLALLKHPFVRLGRSAGKARHAARVLDLEVFRGPRPAPGLGGLQRALAECPAAAMAHPFVDALAEALAPLEILFAATTPQPLSAYVRAHWQALAALTADEDGQPLAARGEAGEMLAGYVTDLLEAAGAGGELALLPADYPAAFAGFAAGRTVRPAGRSHPRIQILGLLEARLQSSGLLILGGLNEGVWPDLPATDPWLSRPMRAAIGLAPPERRIGLMAHDFAQGLAARRVIVTRSLKRDGTPTIPSRWLQRLDAVLEGLGLAEHLENGPDARYAALAHAFDDADPAPVAEPLPTPPVALRPRALSVTRIETWLRDPYAIHARHILGLKPLDPIDAAPDAADRGTMIHDILAAFLSEPWDGDPAAAEVRLLDLGRAAFARFKDRPEIAAVWWPRFCRVAAAFARLEAGRHAEVAARAIEAKGEIALDAPEGPFVLSARADRIDTLSNGTLRLIDYKTGTPPSAKQVFSGLSPQLTLEAAIALDGGFPDIAGDLAALEYMQLSGGDPPLDVKAIAPDKKSHLGSFDEAAYEARSNLMALIVAFDNPQTPYRALVSPMREDFLGDYGHLARVKEWRLTGGGEGD